MAKMKKAFILSSSAIFLVLILAVAFSVNKEIKISESKLAATNIRVYVLNSFINDLENNYFEKILYVSGKYALNSIAEYKQQNNQFPTVIGAFKKDFAGVLKNGTIGSGSIAIPGMGGKSVSAFIGRIEKIFNTTGINVSQIEVKIINIRHTSPWTIEIEAEFKYRVEDKNHIASWDGATNKKAEISIISLKDPETGEVIKNIGLGRWIRHFNSESASSGESFLKRLSGDSELNVYGICREDNRHCGTCGNDCTSIGKVCSNPIGQNPGTCE